MEYMYAALLLHKEGQEINESNVKKVIESAGGKVDDSKVKTVVVALKDVDIEKAIKESAVAPTVAVKEEKKEVKEEKKEEKVSEEKAAAGLSALFG